MMKLAIQGADYWDATADGYIGAAEPFTSQFCLDAVELADLAPGMTLLDVATGPGALALAAARKGATVTAVDFSARMVERLEERMGDLPITARRMDGQALDLLDASFDRACSVFGIPLFPDWRAGLRELARVLRPSGLAVVGVAANSVGFGPNMLLAEARADCVPDQPTPVILESMVELMDRNRLVTALTAAGFGAVTVHAATHDFLVDPELLSAESPMLAANPLLADLSEVDRAAVIAKARALAAGASDGDVVRVPGTAHLAVARRF